MLVKSSAGVADASVFLNVTRQLYEQKIASGTSSGSRGKHRAAATDHLKGIFLLISFAVISRVATSIETGTCTGTRT